jgi:hypothetical protein
MRREKSFLNKLNLILVQILKQEWCVSRVTLACEDETISGMKVGQF